MIAAGRHGTRSEVGGIHIVNVAPRSLVVRAVLPLVMHRPVSSIGGGSAGNWTQVGTVTNLGFAVRNAAGGEGGIHHESAGHRLRRTAVLADTPHRVLVSTRHDRHSGNNRIGFTDIDIHIHGKAVRNQVLGRHIGSDCNGVDLIVQTYRLRLVRKNGQLNQGVHRDRHAACLLTTLGIRDEYMISRGHFRSRCYGVKGSVGNRIIHRGGVPRVLISAVTAVGRHEHRRGAPITDGIIGTDNQRQRAQRLFHLDFFGKLTAIGILRIHLVCAGCQLLENTIHPSVVLIGSTLAHPVPIIDGIVLCIGSRGTAGRHNRDAARAVVLTIHISHGNGGRQRRGFLHRHHFRCHTVVGILHADQVVAAGQVCEIQCGLGNA